METECDFCCKPFPVKQLKKLTFYGETFEVCADCLRDHKERHK